MIWWIASGALVVLAFVFLIQERKQERTPEQKVKDSHTAFIFICLSFATFLAAIITKSLPIPSVEQCVCWTFAGCTLYFSFSLLQKEKLAEAMVVFFFTFTAFLCGLSSVQGLLKAGVLAKVNDAITDYSQKLDVFQTNIDDARAVFSKKIDGAKKEIQAQQDNITNQFKQIGDLEKKLSADESKSTSEYQTNQQNITNQFKQIQILQNKISATESNMAAQIETNIILQHELTVAEESIQNQQKQLSKVEDQVNAIFERSVAEQIRGDDTNDAVFVKKDDGGIICVFRLQSSAVVNSVRIMMQAGEHYGSVQTELLPGVVTGANVIMVTFNKSTDPNMLQTASFYISYTKDLSQPTGIKSLSFDDGRVYCDGQPTWMTGKRVP